MPSAKVKYTLQCIINFPGDHDWVQKQIMIIREKPLKEKDDIKKVDDNEIKTWCCMSQGKSKLTTVFEKNSFEPDDKVEADVKIDQKNCKVDMKGISLRLEQHVHVKAEGNSDSQVNVLIENKYDGVKAGTEDEVKKELKLDLSKIKTTMKGDKKKKGKTKKVSPEDMFLGSCIQPACKGKFVNIEYYLVTVTEFDGCTCCDDMPSCRVEVNVIPPQLPTFCKVDKDDVGWNPEDVEEINFTL